MKKQFALSCSCLIFLILASCDWMIDVDVKNESSNDIVVLIKENKANRTRQVQFRMDPKIFNKLKSTIVYDEELRSMADLFNEAAKKYLKEKGVKING